ncbi:MAG: DUF2314 domain-containing protein [Hyphomicrobiaceae bacterium]|nr:DUF2314 domain-containing protein [Hyphomicrobiaceae bacterium]
MLKRMMISLMALICAIAVTPPTTWAQDKVIRVPDDDAEMVAAIAKARATLPEFWREMEAPGPGVESFALKVAIPYGTDRHEHFWLTDVERRGDQISGIISNDPNNATHVAKGDRYEFTEADISDWLIRRDGKMVGNETMRPLLKRMPAEQAEQYRAMYANP